MKTSGPPNQFLDVLLHTVSVLRFVRESEPATKRPATEKRPRDGWLHSLQSEPLSAHHGTRKDTLLLSAPLGVVTSTVPVVAPVGTVVLISVLETTVNTVVFPLKLTAVAPVRLFPRMMTVAPALPKVGSGSTNGPNPTDRLKTVPSKSERTTAQDTRWLRPL